MAGGTKRTVVIVTALFLAAAIWLVFSALQWLVNDYNPNNNSCEKRFRQIQDVHWASVAFGAPISLAVVVGIVACCCRSSWDAFWKCIDDPCQSCYMLVKATLVLLWILTFSAIAALFAARQRCFDSKTEHAGRLLVSGSAALALAALIPALYHIAGGSSKGSNVVQA